MLYCFYKYTNFRNEKLFLTKKRRQIIENPLKTKKLSDSWNALIPTACLILIYFLTEIPDGGSKKRTETKSRRQT